MEQLHLLEQKIQYTFQNKALLRQALTHSSYANENKIRTGSNERLEFLGDSILGMVVAEFMYHNYPNDPEGDLTRNRALLVCEESLFEVAGRLSLGEHLLLGKGESSGGGRKRVSMSADAVEAILAAVYLDGGIQPARAIIERYILTKDPKKLTAGRDYKTALQEQVQKVAGSVISYALVGETGPDHNKRFTITVSINGTVMGTGEGSTKKEGEQRAAQKALETITETK
ncbi:MAG: ribonuclease III [Eubacteriales bacterium]